MRRQSIAGWLEVEHGLDRPVALGPGGRDEGLASTLSTANATVRPPGCQAAQTSRRLDAGDGDHSRIFRHRQYVKCLRVVRNESWCQGSITDESTM